MKFDSSNIQTQTSPYLYLILILPIIIGGGIFTYNGVASGSLSIENDVLPFAKHILLPVIILIPILYWLFY